MRKNWKIILLVLMLFTLSGCAEKKAPAPAKPQITLSAMQKIAVENSIEYIKNSEFSSKNTIDTSILDVNNAEENSWEFVYTDSGKAEKNTVDTTDWIITLGDRSGFNFAVIVCDSTTAEVIGYMPIE